MFGLIAGLVGSVIQGRGASRAAGQQARAAEADREFQLDIYNRNEAKFAGALQDGNAGRNALSFELGLQGRPSGYRGYEESAGNKYIRDQSRDAIQASAAANGGLFSAATMQELGRDSANYSQTFREQYLNRLAGMADTGLSAAGMSATNGANTAAGVSNALSARGNAQSAGTIGVANAFTGGIQNVLSGFGYQNAQAQQPQTGNWWGANPRGGR